MSEGSLERIFVYPIKSLDGTTVERATVAENGGLEWDRRYAIVDEDGTYVNGKRDRRVNQLQATFDLAERTVSLESPAAGPRQFHLEDDQEGLSAWLSDFFDQPVRLICEESGGFPDDTDASGPTLITQESLESVASWYDGIDPREMRRRLRPNLVVAGDQPFWEDRLYEAPGTVVPFAIGSCRFHGVNPCQRCVVPSQDPDTGEVTVGFRQRFVDQREATLPEWASREWFDHYFRLMVNTRVPTETWGSTLAVGDSLTVGDPIDDRSGNQ